MVVLSIIERRLSLLTRILLSPGTNKCRYLSTGGSGKQKNISIGDVSKDLPEVVNNPELIPVKYLPRDEDLPLETVKHLKWLMQKDLLGQDVFLIGRPGPLRRQLALQYLQLTQRELGKFFMEAKNS